MVEIFNKKNLIEELSKKNNLTQSDVQKIIEEAFKIITQKLAEGQPVRIVSFGTFEVRTRLGRLGRNPKTGERLPIPTTKRPVFVPGKELKEAVRGIKN